MSTITIDSSGRVVFLWDDRLRALFDLGEASICRASHVEPTPEAKWTADLSPVGGPVLGPYDLRCDALAAEAEWLERNILT